MPALIVLVERGPKGGRIRGVDDDRPMVLGAEVPDRIELRIVDGDQPTVFVAMTEPEPLVELESSRACFESTFQALGLPRTPARIVDSLKIHVGEGDESALVGLIERIDRVCEPFVPATIQVYDGSDAGCIHLAEDLL